MGPSLFKSWPRDKNKKVLSILSKLCLFGTNKTNLNLVKELVKIYYNKAFRVKNLNSVSWAVNSKEME